MGAPPLPFRETPPARCIERWVAWQNLHDWSSERGISMDFPLLKSEAFASRDAAMLLVFGSAWVKQIPTFVKKMWAL